MRHRATLACLLLILWALCWASPTWAAEDLSGNDPITQIHRIARHTNKAASQARTLGWIAVSLGLVNLALLVTIAAKLLGYNLPFSPTANLQVGAIRRRQRNIEHDIARVEEYFKATEAERIKLAETLEAINRRIEATSAEIYRDDLPPKPK